VHDPGILRTPGFGRRFLDGEGIHIGPVGQGRTRLAADKVGDDTVTGDVGGDLQTQAGEISRYHPAGALLLVGQLGMLVEIPAEALEFRKEGPGFGCEAVLEVFHGCFQS
jgi:hypothetical protein